MMQKKPRIVASIEARMGSSRFPGKVLADICGQPALSRLLHRLRQSRYLDDIVLATTSERQDQVLVHWAKQNSLPYYCGSETDVLQRVVEAHQQQQSDLVVEITGDCILLDAEIIDQGIETFLNHSYDVVNNVRLPSYPLGIDVQVFRYNDLRWVAENIFDPAIREHVSLYFYEQPERYKIHHLLAPRRWQGPQYRFMLDYVEDHKFITEIYRNLMPMFGENFGLEDIMNLLKHKPELLLINQHCKEKEVR